MAYSSLHAYPEYNDSQDIYSHPEGGNDMSTSEHTEYLLYFRTKAKNILVKERIYGSFYYLAPAVRKQVNRGGSG